MKKYATLLPKKLNSFGETIVEVLIAIGVISLVLGGAFASSSQSLQATRQSEERVEALKLVEGQLERLKGAGSGIYTTGIPFCINAAGAIQAGTCVESLASGATAYTLSVTRDAANINRFTVTASWNKLGGGLGAEQVRIIYKVYP